MSVARLVLSSVLLMSVSACATASVSYSDVAPGTQPVSAESSKFNFLGLTPTPVEQLQGLRDELSQQCGGRGVTGVVARASTVYVIIGVIEEMEVAGYCAQP